MLFLYLDMLVCSPTPPNLGPLSLGHVLGSGGHQVATGLQFSSFPLERIHVPGQHGRLGCFLLCALHGSLGGSRLHPTYSGSAGLWQTVGGLLLLNASGEHRLRHGRPPGPTAAATGASGPWAAAGRAVSSGSCRLDSGVSGSAPAHRPSHPKRAVCGRQRA